MDIPEYNPSLYEVVDKMGSGSYGSVYKVRVKSTGELAALKTIEMEEGESMDDALTEIQVLRDCDSPYVTRYLNCYRQGFDKLYVVMELCEIGSITSLMSKLSLPGLPEPTIAYVIMGTLQGLRYLHGQHKMHRDIKGGNVLVNKKGEVKLADFGITAMLNATWGRRNTFIGSPYWMAPEMLTADSYDKMVDIWATGITAIELAEGKPPLSQYKWQDAIRKIPSLPPPTLKEPTKWSPEFRDFLTLCLKMNPKERADIPVLLEHPFIARKHAPLGPHHLLPLIAKLG
ncbi:putative serine/threonine-protein kinase 3 [Monocercomonoides exilis]|uniref:putative serine/threonine-protein kinase 3 n=1 Tax=Monocercomonoides exilis TaxID=2049356 RepID=UPI00355A6652|nr:putative serine/threonine-protein kinase 3 [Monocercomonoides exilis]|eukprot:MONOS_7601.1-p1 / transcript=MONOS_7601.1 / gene=MONOS_7601 / organism=Monocercomonoides_exilis_PA203 / gene_product=STE / transcript_product=STE / location=Mono_scaffold00264:5912-7256(-) / protein_length=286 / sequence_SO=supercontig / SO=protein_coding / is_pseudo=false